MTKKKNDYQNKLNKLIMLTFDSCFFWVVNHIFTGKSGSNRQNQFLILHRFSWRFFNFINAFQALHIGAVIAVTYLLGFVILLCFGIASCLNLFTWLLLHALKTSNVIRAAAFPFLRGKRFFLWRLNLSRSHFGASRQNRGSRSQR